MFIVNTHNDLHFSCSSLSDVILNDYLRFDDVIPPGLNKLLKSLLMSNLTMS